MKCRNVEMKEYFHENNSFDCEILIYYRNRSFRLQSRRPLKKLMVTTDGCNQRSAGIGNIAYVKDLQTDRIVTTSLRCSKFGIAYRRSSYYGWVGDIR